MDHDLKHRVHEVARLMRDSTYAVAMTGAGISVSAGIPPFRGDHSLWRKYDPLEYGTIDAFRANPAKVWKMLAEVHDIIHRARPSKGHEAMAKLEHEGYLKAIITQNIDDLHQKAGSTNVIEYHGNAKELRCLMCGGTFRSEEYEGSDEIPECRSCMSILKPNVVLFGEMIPERPLESALEAAHRADLFFVIGTSAYVYPAGDIPRIAKESNATIVEINIAKTALTETVADHFLMGSADDILTMLLHEMNTFDTAR